MKKAVLDGASKRAGAPTFALFAGIAALDGSGDAEAGAVRKAYTVDAHGPAIIVRYDERERDREKRRGVG